MLAHLHVRLVHLGQFLHLVRQFAQPVRLVHILLVLHLAQLVLLVYLQLVQKQVVRPSRHVRFANEDMQVLLQIQALLALLAVLCVWLVVFPLLV